jgi:hypothetical protein
MKSGMEPQHGFQENKAEARGKRKRWQTRLLKPYVFGEPPCLRRIDLTNDVLSLGSFSP